MICELQRNGSSKPIIDPDAAWGAGAKSPRIPPLLAHPTTTLPISQQAEVKKALDNNLAVWFNNNDNVKLINGSLEHAGPAPNLRRIG